MPSTRTKNPYGQYRMLAGIGTMEFWRFLIQSDNPFPYFGWSKNHVLCMYRVVLRHKLKRGFLLQPNTVNGVFGWIGALGTRVAIVN